MNRYQPTMPRTALAVAALAMSVLTLAISVAPARLGEGTYAAAPAANAPAATEVAIIPARIEVVAAREPKTMFGAVRQFFARKVQPS
jgi:hypothetical protein